MTSSIDTYETVGRVQRSWGGFIIKWEPDTVGMYRTVEDLEARTPYRPKSRKNNKQFIPLLEHPKRLVIAIRTIDKAFG